MVEILILLGKLIQESEVEWRDIRRERDNIEILHVPALLRTFTEARETCEKFSLNSILAHFQVKAIIFIKFVKGLVNS